MQLPVMLHLRGRRCVVVGGGAVAVRRAGSLLACGAEVVVVAPQIDPRLNELPIERVERGYAEGDLDEAFLVVVATDQPDVNQCVAADAARLGVLVNRADDADEGDLTFMAHDRRGPLTLAVDTAHTSAAAAKSIREELFEALDDDWVTLLSEARPWRARIRGNPGAKTADAPSRSAKLRRLTDREAMQVLKNQGVDALRRHLQAVAEDLSDH